MFNISRFWNKTNLLNLTLIPTSYIYYFIYLIYRILKKEKKLSIPVICIGNLTLGGAGKLRHNKAKTDDIKKFKNTFVLIEAMEVDLKALK